MRIEFTFNYESDTLLVLEEESVSSSGNDFFISTMPRDFRFGESLDLELEHGRPTAAYFRVGQVHGDAGRFGLAQQVVHGALHRQFGAARDLAAASGGHARVQAGVFRLDMREDKRQSVLFVLSWQMFRPTL